MNWRREKEGRGIIGRNLWRCPLPILDRKKCNNFIITTGMFRYSILCETNLQEPGQLAVPVVHIIATVFTCTEKNIIATLRGVLDMPGSNREMCNTAQEPFYTKSY